MRSARARRRLDTDARRREILAAAIEVFAQRDAAQVPITEIADRADSSPALIYHYFGDKAGLAAAALGQAADQLVDRMAVDPDETIEAQLGQGLTIYLDFIEAHPASWSALLRAGGDPSLTAIARRVDDYATSLALDALSGGRREADALLELAVRGWLELVKATCLNWLTTGWPDRTVLQAFLVRAFNGCVAAAEDVAGTTPP